MAQRITGGMMIDNFSRNLNAANVRMYNQQHQLATNKKMVRLSDDPVNTVKAVSARSRLRDVEQYKKNLDDADAWLTQTESALSEMNSIIKRAYELAVYASNDPMSDDDKTAMSKELRELRDQVVTLANTTLGDRYIFGGYNMTSAPYTVDEENSDIFYNGDSMVDGGLDTEAAFYQINRTLEFDVAICGADFLGVEEENIYNILGEFTRTVDAMSDLNEDGTGILHENVQPFIDLLQRAETRTLNMMAEVGGRSARITLMRDRLANEEINYTQMKSDVEDLDQAEAIMKFSMEEAVYRSALGIGGRVLPVSLMDFLR